MCGKSTLDNLSFDHNPLSRFTFFCKYLSPLKSHKISKISVWISVFRRKKQFENSIHGCRDIKQNPSLFLLGSPVILMDR